MTTIPANGQPANREDIRALISDLTSAPFELSDDTATIRAANPAELDHLAIALGAEPGVRVRVDGTHRDATAVRWTTARAEYRGWVLLVQLREDVDLVALGGELARDWAAYAAVTS